MPYTPSQVALFFSKHSPLNKKQQAKFESEIHDNPSMGHAKKVTAEMKRGHSLGKVMMLNR